MNKMNYSKVGNIKVSVNIKTLDIPQFNLKQIKTKTLKFNFKL